MSDKLQLDRCCNPCKGPNEKGHVGKGLRNISKTIQQQFPHLQNNSKICNQCRKKLKTDFMSLNSSVDDDDINESMEVDEIFLEGEGSHVSTTECDLKSAEEILHEIITELKEKLHSLQGNHPLKLKILTVAPSSWSVNKIAKEFGVSWKFAKKSKELKASKGILPDTTAKVGKTLPSITIEKVKAFYDEDSNSRIMPGKKDCVTVEVNGIKTKVQKRMLLLNLKELHSSFEESYPYDKIGFSTFAKLLPKHCVLPGASGTHSVCVCTIHQNCKLMLDAINIAQLTQKSEKSISGYKECLQQTMCNNPSPKCYFDECKGCPGFEILFSTLFELLNENNYDQVEYSLWTATDRCRLETFKQNNIDFVDTLCNKLQILKPHSFIAKEQSNFIADKKKNLIKGEVLVMFDFSENYTFTAQDAAQAFHFTNDQCTVFPVIYYYKTTSGIIFKTCVFLSNSLKHDTAAVYTIQHLLIPEIRKNADKLKKIIYVTDGAKQHFKNRFQIANLLCHRDDFLVEAEWHFCATAHGKSCYDGIGATFKREAYKASLTAKPNQTILTHDALFKWAQNHFNLIKCFYFSQTEHTKMSKKLNKRFELAKPVPQILQNHCFQVTGEKELLIKRYSNATEGIKVTL